MNRRRLLLLLLDAALAFVVFDVSHRLFRGSTGVPQLCDSTYSLLAAESILTTGSADLRCHIPSDADARRQMHGYVDGHDMPYQFVRHGDPQAIYYGYPLASSVMSLPLLHHYGTRRGLSTVRSDGTPNLEIEALLQRRIASRISAATAALFYILARFFCPPLLAALLALGFGLGSPMWSTLAMALWSHTWMVFWLTAAIVLLVIAERREVKSWPTSAALGIGLGIALFAMAATRPHAVLSAGPILLYVLLTDRKLLTVTAITGLAWSAGYIAASYSIFGTPTPPSVYEPSPIDGRDIFNRLAWLLASPSRGLLVYCPYLAVIAALLFRHRHSIRNVGLLIPAGLSCAAYLALFSTYSGWHAGSSYGPRYFSDLIPWFVLAGAMAVDAMLRSGAGRLRMFLETFVLGAAFAWGIWVHARGANSKEAWEWNYLSIAMGQEEAVRDWQHPQFLTGITFIMKSDGSVVELR